MIAQDRPSTRSCHRTISRQPTSPFQCLQSSRKIPTDGLHLTDKLNVTTSTTSMSRRLDKRATCWRWIDTWHHQLYIDSIHLTITVTCSPWSWHFHPRTEKNVYRQVIWGHFITQLLCCFRVITLQALWNSQTFPRLLVALVPWCS